MCLLFFVKVSVSGIRPFWRYLMMESVAYMLNIARIMGGRPITDDEFEPFFVGVLGDEYRPMVKHRFENFQNLDPDWLADAIKVSGKIAREDARTRQFDHRSFLVAIAEGNAKWQKKVSAED